MTDRTIYALIDPKDNSIRYVGRTKNLEHRFKAHLNRAHNKTSLKRVWVDDLIKSGLKPEVLVLDVVPKEDGGFWEAFYTDLFRSWGFDLLNNRDYKLGNQTSFRKGGAPFNKGKGRKFVCTQCSCGYSPNNDKQRTCSMECSILLRKKEGNYNGYKKGLVPWNKNNGGYYSSKAKTVQQFDQNGDLIAEFRSCKSAAEAINGNAEAIRMCCIGKLKTSGKFKWKYK